jgi:hypothetical protein
MSSKSFCEKNEKTNHLNFHLMSYMQVDKNLRVYPFIDELVDSLYTDELNKLIDSENVQFDKRTFLMFIIIYFSTRLYASNESISKENIKLFMTDLIRNPMKRGKCIELFMMFEKSLIGELTSSVIDDDHRIK